MAVAVNVFVKDDSVSPAAVVGVLVGIYNPSNLTLVAVATTDSNGRAAFMLPGSGGGLAYEVRLYKLGVIFSNPKAITVLEPVSPPSTNDFDVAGTLLTLQPATDPRLCRCTGRFVDFSNKPLAKKLFRISAKGDFGEQNPKVVDGNMVPMDAEELYTDVDGFITVDLFRTGEYYVTFAGEEDTVWNILIPDRSSVNLIDLIHPRPVTLTWDQTVAPGNAVSVHVGETLSIPFSILFSDFENVTKDVGRWIRLFNSDDARMSLGLVSGNAQAVVTGTSAGSAQVTVQVQPDLLPFQVPPYSISAPPLQVTIAP